MKSIDQVRSDLARKLELNWHRWIAGQGGDQDDVDAQEPAALAAMPWPMTVPLGRPGGADLRAGFRAANDWAIGWERLAVSLHLSLRAANRNVHGVTLNLPTHLIVDSLDAAARLAGNGWPARLAAAAERWSQLRQHFPTTASASVLRYCAPLPAVDFEMLVCAATWFGSSDATGLTPRQVPLAGVHGKWLNKHRTVLQALAGKAELGLTERPSRVLFTYLDPAHLAASGRRHDSYTLGDSARPVYLPDVAVICENKDTAELFSPVPGAVAIFGNGDAAIKHLPQVPWLAAVLSVYYWGDLDADGFETLAGLRAAGVPALSLLMDESTYERYEIYGSWTDKDGQPLMARAPRELPDLTAPEQAMYRKLLDPAWQRVRRIEQERIPLTVAQQTLLTAAEGEQRSA